eukprot:MONOS_15144.1-p1 / transcript=MONOS_15144.1 / gene=MONOS_15144 / organism=Monocercomonoides_exilis_PA203 / gene_product=unspecified product / transcript_product=unspecified product / location=Mono_scaffold01154:9415-12054(+) / protein_length=796 / sequence_SO=supercontig / SO=protein_coding / is_pseudo=false
MEKENTFNMHSFTEEVCQIDKSNLLQPIPSYSSSFDTTSTNNLRGYDAVAKLVIDEHKPCYQQKSSNLLNWDNFMKQSSAEASHFFEKESSHTTKNETVKSSFPYLIHSSHIDQDFEHSELLRFPIGKSHESIGPNTQQQFHYSFDFPSSIDKSSSELDQIYQRSDNNLNDFQCQPSNSSYQNPLYFDNSTKDTQNELQEKRQNEIPAMNLANASRHCENYFEIEKEYPIYFMTSCDLVKEASIQLHLQEMQRKQKQILQKDSSFENDKCQSIKNDAFSTTTTAQNSLCISFPFNPSSKPPLSNFISSHYVDSALECDSSSTEENTSCTETSSTLSSHSLDPHITETIARWHPVRASQRELCYDIDTEKNGERDSAIAQFREEWMALRWKKREEKQERRRMMMEERVAINEVVDQRKTETEESFDLQCDEENDTEKERSANEYFHNARLREEKERRARLRIIKREIQEAKMHLRLFGKWVENPFLRSEEEKQMWEEARKKALEKNKIFAPKELLERKDIPVEGSQAEDLSNVSDELTLEELRNVLIEGSARGMSELDKEQLKIKIGKMEEKMEKEVRMKEMSDLDRYVEQCVKDSMRKAEKLQKKKSKLENATQQKKEVTSTSIFEQSFSHLQKPNQTCSSNRTNSYLGVQCFANTDSSFKRTSNPTFNRTDGESLPPERKCSALSDEDHYLLWFFSQSDEAFISSNVMHPGKKSYSISPSLNFAFPPFVVPFCSFSSFSQLKLAFLPNQTKRELISNEEKVGIYDDSMERPGYYSIFELKEREEERGKMEVEMI